MADRRKKGCPNQDCILNQKKVKQSIENDYCPKCATRLVYVCAKCFDEIEDLGPKHRICSLCEIEAEEKRKKTAEMVKGGAIKVGKGVAAVVVPVAGAIGGKVIKDMQNDAKDQGVKIIEDTIKNIFKKS